MKTLLKIAEMIEFLPAPVKDAIHAVAKATGNKTDDLELHRHSHSEKAKVNGLDPKSRRALKYVSARTQDRDDEIVIPEAINLAQFKKYGHVLVNHNYSLLPVGSDVSIEADDFGIKALTEYADTGEGTLANVVWHLISQGHLKASSIGFVPTSYTKPGARDWDHVTNQLQTAWKEFDKARAEKSVSRIITGGVLLEHSDVSVPCNADAEVITVLKSMHLDGRVTKQLGIEVVDDPASGLTLVKSLNDLLVDGGEWQLFPALKPYPNEHAARQTDPDKYARFARQKDKGGEGVDFIFGITKDGKTELQSVRFDREKFSPEQAKAWLKEHKMREELEEAAKEKTVVATTKAADSNLTESLRRKLISIQRRGEGAVLDEADDLMDELDDDPDEDELLKLKEQVNALLAKVKAVGRGRMGGPYSAGPGGECVCPKCGHEQGHDAGTPCTEVKCEKCGTMMARKEPESVKVVKPAPSVRVLFVPPDPGLIEQKMAEAVERALARRVGKLR